MARERLITVCDACLCASCWHGIFRCDDSQTAGTTKKTARQLRALNLEHPSYYSRKEVERVCGSTEYTMEAEDDSMSFENATPRPWTKNNTYGWLEGANGTQVTVYDLGISMRMNSPDEEERANAELIVTAVNARDDLMNAAQAAIHALKSYQYGNSSPDLAQEVIVALEAALKLARAES